jgi:hypothetical protein
LIYLIGHVGRLLSLVGRGRAVCIAHSIMFVVISQNLVPILAVSEIRGEACVSLESELSHARFLLSVQV